MRINSKEERGSSKLERFLLSLLDNFSKLVSELTTSFKISQNERILFLMQLYVAFKSGLPISMALKSMALSWKGGMRPYIELIHQKVLRGKALSEAIETLPVNLYPKLIISMIRAGEYTGNLERTLFQSYKLLEARRELTWAIISSLIYPLVTLIVGIGAVMLFNSIFFPVIIDIYQNLNLPMPWITSAVMKIRSLISLNTLKYLLLTLALFLLAFIQFREVIVDWFTRIALLLPGIRDVYRRFYVSLFLRVVYLATQAGVPFSESVKLASEMMPGVIRGAFWELYKAIREGEPLHEAMKDLDWLFSRTVINMVRVYEETGDEEVLRRIADLLEFEYNLAVKNFVQLFEPIVMVLMGLFALFITTGVFAPLVNLLRM